MKRLILARFAYFLLGTLVSFVLGIYVAGVFGAGKGQMLAAAAIVISWGFVAVILFLVVSIFTIRRIPAKRIASVNWVLFILAALLIGITYYRALQRKKTRESQSNSSLLVRPKIHFTHYTPLPQNSSTMGLGFFQPDFYNHGTIHFYGNVNLEKSLDEHSPTDSIVFTQNELGFNTSYAPPWLFPEHLKLDYGIVMFKVLGMGDDFLKVEVNKQTGQFSYLPKQLGRFIPWPEFLLSVNSAQLVDKSVQKVRLKPLDHASEISSDFEWLIPLLVQEDWMYVKLVDGNHREQGKGWIQWQRNNRLLIRYSLLN